MKKDLYVAIDLSKAYLLARHNYESRKVLGDDWLSEERRMKATTVYIEVGKDFNNFFFNMAENVKDPNTLYNASVAALKIFRDNLDILWMYAYSGNMREIIWLTK